MNPLPALGMIETVGITGLIAAADAAAKAAEVMVIGRQGADAGIVTVYVIGDVAAVEAAVRAGEAEAERTGHCRSVHVIPRPDPAVLKMLGYGMKSGTDPNPPNRVAAKEARSEGDNSAGSVSAESEQSAAGADKRDVPAAPDVPETPDVPEVPEAQDHPEPEHPNKSDNRKGRR